MHNHHQKAYEFRKNEKALNIGKENTRILDKINDIQKRPGTEQIFKPRTQEGYRN